MACRLEPAFKLNRDFQPQSLTNAFSQPIAARVLGVPRGDPKKTDVAVTREQIETLDKFKGAPQLVSATAGATLTFKHFIALLQSRPTSAACKYATP